MYWAAGACRPGIGAVSDGVGGKYAFSARCKAIANIVWRLTDGPAAMVFDVPDTAENVAKEHELPAKWQDESAAHSRKVAAAIEPWVMS